MTILEREINISTIKVHVSSNIEISDDRDACREKEISCECFRLEIESFYSCTVYVEGWDG